jgi:hypothetical protein
MDNAVTKSLQDAIEAVREAHAMHVVQRKIIEEQRFVIDLLERTVATKDEIIARLLRSN